MNIDQAVDEIITQIDKRTLLGAAYECMSKPGQERFRASMRKILTNLEASRPSSAAPSYDCYTCQDTGQIINVCDQGHYGSTITCTCEAGKKLAKS